jgi:hypothetical protein
MRGKGGISMPKYRKYVAEVKSLIAPNSEIPIHCIALGDHATLTKTDLDEKVNLKFEFLTMMSEMTNGILVGR